MTQGKMRLRIWNVEHGACATLWHESNDGRKGKLAMIDSGSTSEWSPSAFIKKEGRDQLDYLIITNADQDHISDLEGLWQKCIKVKSLIRNRNISVDDLQKIKEESGDLTEDMKRYLEIHGSYTAPSREPFNESMGGIKYKVFCNKFPRFKDTNNLSCVVFIEFAGFGILFPGDLEKKGWLALLERNEFIDALTGVDVLVASHHGRENGYCEEVFEYCKPRVVVISDKPIEHGTQEGMTQSYRQRVINNHADGIPVKGKRRRVLTTRKDGWIEFLVNTEGKFTVATETGG